jgi:hypothetical protein
MDPSQAHTWRCIYGSVSCSTPINIVTLLKKVKFDGKGETYVYKYAFEFIQNYFSHNITHEGIMCNLFTLTFEGWIKIWCENLPIASIHTWKQFIHEFLYAFENYDNDKLCNKLQGPSKVQDESLEEFTLRFMHLLYIFHFNDIPFVVEWFPYLVNVFDEQDQPVIDKSESCIETHSHVDLDSHENPEDSEVVVEQHMFGSLFTFVNMNHG